jgi:hypothetical protein
MCAFAWKCGRPGLRKDSFSGPPKGAKGLPPPFGPCAQVLARAPFGDLRSPHASPATTGASNLKIPWGKPHAGSSPAPGNELGGRARWRYRPVPKRVPKRLGIGLFSLEGGQHTTGSLV